MAYDSNVFPNRAPIIDYKNYPNIISPTSVCPKLRYYSSAAFITFYITIPRFFCFDLKVICNQKKMYENMQEKLFLLCTTCTRYNNYNDSYIEQFLNGIAHHIRFKYINLI